MISPYLLVDEALGLDQFCRAHGPRVREVETQTIRIYQRAFLLDMRPQQLAQRGMQEMGGRMVSPGCGGPGCVDFRADVSPDRELALA